jgi:uncharacterized protein DUF5667
MLKSARKRFAEAVEGGPIEPDLDESLRYQLVLVEALREAGRPIQLDADTRRRMRQRLLADFEPQPETADGAVDSRPGSVPQPKSLARSRRAGVRGRLLVAAAAALCLLLSLSAMSLLMARDALPGDALYGVKRSAESAELGLTFGAESRGFKHLQFATGRLDELEALAASGAGPNSYAGPYQVALDEFDADAAAGSRLLVEAATNGNSSLLGALHDWADQQSQRMQLTVPVLPEPAAMHAAESRELLRRIAERAALLRARVGCLTVTSGAADDIGLLPAEGPCQPVNLAPTGSSSTSPDDPNRRPSDQPTSAPPSGTGSASGEQPAPSQPDHSTPGASDSPLVPTLPSYGSQEGQEGQEGQGELPPVPQPQLPIPITQVTLPLLPSLPGSPTG